MVLRSSSEDKSDRNKSVNSSASDFGLSGGGQCNPGGTLFEKPGSRECETMVRQQGPQDLTSLRFGIPGLWFLVDWTRNWRE